MSYDLRLAVKVEDTDIFAVIAEPRLSSPTYNLGPMFRECMGWNFTQGEYRRVSEVWPLIEHGISELRMRPDKYKKYNAPNGWGDVSAALEVLESLSDCIRENTASGDHWGWNSVPPDKLWVCW